MLELQADQPIFVGLKLDTSLRRQLESVAGPDRKYVSADDSTFLRICRAGDQQYVGKLIHERLTLDRIDDIRRSIFSILHRLCPETRLPSELEILACSTEPGAPRASEGEAW